jgi:hypothetical protein
MCSLMHAYMYFRPHMSISRDRLETAHSLIKRDLKQGTDQWWWYTTGTFVKFSSDVRVSSYSSSVKDDTLKRKCSNMHRHLRMIKDDLDTLLTMLDQANWQKKMVREGHLGTEYNMFYGTALADAFITKYRSAYDTIAKALIEIRSDRGRPPRPSFTELREVCTEEEFVRILGDNLAHLIQSCDWYDQVLKARDDIVHYNLKSSGFMHSRILFQITKWDKEKKRFVNLINIPEVMINENLADFELYAAVHIPYTFWLLEEFAKLGYEILSPSRFPDAEPKKGYLGLDVLKDSIERVLATPQARQKGEAGKEGAATGA